MSASADNSAAGISLPNGGGSIQGIGESFAADLFTGTGQYSIPIATSPGRDGFQPVLSLDYSSGSGNGLFGLGWNLSLARITRKTERGIPRYQGDDVFKLSGKEDLVPAFKDDGSGLPDIRQQDLPLNGQNRTYTIRRYMPRTEGEFLRIEFWESDRDVQQQPVYDAFWRITDRQNVTRIFGRGASARIENPDDTTQIFSWLIQEVYDARGHHILYEYAEDDPATLADAAGEHNRQHAQVYPRRILYGNVADTLTGYDGSSFSSGVSRTTTDERDIARQKQRGYLFEVIFDYGDLDKPTSSRPVFDYPSRAHDRELFSASVPVRRDRFSSYRSGFEIRTLRRCHSILMVHHIRDLGGPTLVKSTDFEYHSAPHSSLSLLSASAVTGYDRDSNGDYHAQSLPPSTFSYSGFDPDSNHYQPVRAQNENLPGQPLNDPDTTLIDLSGNGLPDLLQTTPNGMVHWRNLGDGLLDHPHVLPEAPSDLRLSDPGVTFADLSGNGLTDLVVSNHAVAGYFELEAERPVNGRLSSGWSPTSFQRFTSLPGVDFSDPNLQIVDLTGNGLSDLLVSTDTEFVWFPGEGEQGFGAPVHAPKQHGLQSIFFGDSERRVRLADMSGDGLQDIVQLHDGSVVYWPNLGYGRFGVPITMSGNTRLPRNFNPARLFLTDLDGSGTADLVYVDFNRVLYWLNRSGNGFSERQVIHGTPITLDTTALTFSDFFGNGTACILWSYGAGSVRDSNYKVLDFCAGQKPYLLDAIDNGVGASTRIHYATSTKHYLRDTEAGHYWATNLPFPVHVVDRIETIDHIGQSRLSRRFRYHHGHYDGREREFRGFGRVDQIDSEVMDPANTSPEYLNEQPTYATPPVETRTWFHTGVFQNESDLLDRFESEFLAGTGNDADAGPVVDSRRFDLGGSEVLFDLTAGPEEAYRALGGAVLRTEIYGLDDSTEQDFPYQVSEFSWNVGLVQSRSGNTHAVYLRTPRDSIVYQYERKHNGQNLIDPRISHDLVLAKDRYGNPLHSASIAYGRRHTSHSEQERNRVTLVRKRYCDPLIDDVDHRHSQPFERLRHELTGFQPPVDQPCRADMLLAAIQSAQSIPAESEPDFTTLQIQLLEHEIDLFWADDLSGPAVEGSAGRRGLAHSARQLAVTPGLRQSIYDAGMVSTADGQAGGYLSRVPGGWGPAADGDWWTTSEIHIPDPARYYLPSATMDAFGSQTALTYDPYDLFPVRIVDAVGNREEKQYDYRVLEACLIRDINGNHFESKFDLHGRSCATAAMGKAGLGAAASILGIDDASRAALRANSEADSLEGAASLIDSATRAALLSNPDGNSAAYSAALAAAVLGKASTRYVYDFDAYRTRGEPVTVCRIEREQHHSLNANAPLQLRFSYTDGFGRTLQVREQAEADAAGNRQWSVTGWTIFNNKGLPVRQANSFISATHSYESPASIAAAGQPEFGATIFYDPLGRVVCKLFPDHAFSKTQYEPWLQREWDRNDTALLDPASDTGVAHYCASYVATIPGFETWLRQRIHDPSQPPQNPNATERAALQSMAHADTPTTLHLEPRGGTFLTVQDDGNETLATRQAIGPLGIVRSIIDPRGITCTTYFHDLAGRPLAVDSVESGSTRQLPDVNGNALKQWDALGTLTENFYDSLRRPVRIDVTQSGGASSTTQALIYGESHAQGFDTNLLGKIWRHYDGAGLHETTRVDFKGNVLSEKRSLLADATQAFVGWPVTSTGLLVETAAASLLESSTALGTNGYELEADFDAFGRMTRQRLPDGSEYRATYNPAGMLETVSLEPPGGAAELFVENVQYNARSQKTLIKYANGTEIQFIYDPLTHRLTRQLTLRTGTAVQDLRYDYDAIGNLTNCRDEAQSAVTYRGQVVEPESRYRYDAFYRLIEATGREHESMTACHAQRSGDSGTEFLPFPQPGSNTQALASYTQTFQYDPGGNLHTVDHRNPFRHFVRQQAFDAASNRIVSSDAGCPNEDQSFGHDANGNLLSLSHLPALNWDHLNQLTSVQLNQGANPDRAYYQYASDGQRMRKTVVTNNGNDVSERIYFGPYEVFVRRVAGNLRVLKDTTHIDALGRVARIDRDRNTLNPDQVDSRTVRYVYTNFLGSNTLEMSASGQKLSVEEYYPFGGTAFQSGSSQAETGLRRYRYAGRERDQETGLYYFGARYYAPWLCRWISADNVKRTDDINGYRFVKSSPLGRIDSNGYDSEEAEKPETDEWAQLSDPEYYKASAKVGVLIGARQTAATLNPFNTGQAVQEDQARATQLIIEGRYDDAVNVATGVEEYIDLAERAESKSEAAALIAGEKIGTNDMVEAATGEDRNAESLSGWQRAGKWLSGGGKMVNTAFELLTGARAVRGGFKGAGTSSLELLVKQIRSAQASLTALRVRRIGAFKRFAAKNGFGPVRDRYKIELKAVEAEAKAIANGTFTKIKGLKELPEAQRKLLSEDHLNSAKRELDDILEEAEKSQRKLLTDRKSSQVEVVPQSEQAIHGATAQAVRGTNRPKRK